MTTNTILGGDKLTDRFGRWPSFHDADILSLSRSIEGASETITVIIHLFRMTNEVDSKGFYVLDKHTRASLRFYGCEDIRLNEFDHGILFDLKLSDHDSAEIEVGLDSSYGIDGTFKCERIEVLSAEPSNDKGALVSPNQSTDPTLSSGTLPAGQESRHP
jgi:hypothetical protein